jgi:hypothetical protein
MEYSNDNTKTNNMSLTKIEENFMIQSDDLKKKGSALTIHDIIPIFCSNQDDTMFLNFYCMKWLTNLEKTVFIDIIRSNLHAVIEKGYPKVTIHVCLKSLSISQIDKYYSLFRDASTIFKEEFPDRLEKCYLYHCSSIFTYIYKLISHLLEKETLKRVEVYKNKQI